MKRLPWIKSTILLTGAATLQCLAGAGVKEAPTFTEDVAPIVFNHCTECHRKGEVAPFTLKSYRDVKKRGRLIAKVTQKRFMPPWHPVSGHGEFRDSRRLSEEQIETLQRWVASGMQEGPVDQLPELPHFTHGWQLGQPDLIVTLPKAYEVQADGPDIYRNFVIPLDLTEDKWVAGFEVRPSARSVLHHVIIRLDTSGEARRRDGRDGTPGFPDMQGLGGGESSWDSGEDIFSGSLGGIGGWAVGGTPRLLPLGLARKLPKGADLVVEAHFHPSGKIEREQTTIGLYFAKKKPDRTLLGMQVPSEFGRFAGIDVPAGTKGYKVTGQFTTPVDIELIDVGAHAHYICEQAKAVATLPDGTQLPLFYIDAWDFNWQGRYLYKQPVFLPAGTTIKTELIYDNSADNPTNPFYPPRRIQWGLQSTDEMGSVLFTAVAVREADVAQFNRSVREQVVAEARK